MLATPPTTGSMVSADITFSLTPPNGTNRRTGVSLARSRWVQRQEWCRRPSGYPGRAISTRGYIPSTPERDRRYTGLLVAW